MTHTHTDGVLPSQPRTTATARPAAPSKLRNRAASWTHPRTRETREAWPCCSAACRTNKGHVCSASGRVTKSVEELELLHCSWTALVAHRGALHEAHVGVVVVPGPIGQAGDVDEGVPLFRAHRDILGD